MSSGALNRSRRGLHRWHHSGPDHAGRHDLRAADSRPGPGAHCGASRGRRQLRAVQLARRLLRRPHPGTGVGIVLNDLASDYDVQIDGTTVATLVTPAQGTHWINGLTAGEQVTLLGVPRPGWCVP